MRARSNDEQMTGKDWVALVVFVALVVWISVLLGPAIDRELAIGDARIEAHKASLVSQ